MLCFGFMLRKDCILSSTLSLPHSDPHAVFAHTGQASALAQSCLKAFPCILDRLQTLYRSSECPEGCFLLQPHFKSFPLDLQTPALADNPIFMKCVRLCFNKENLICLLSLHLNVALRGTFLSPQKYGICCTHSPPFGGNTALKLLFMERTVTCVSQIPSRLCVSVYQDYNSHHCVMLHLPHVGLSQIFDD